MLEVIRICFRALKSKVFKASQDNKKGAPAGVCQKVTKPYFSLHVKSASRPCHFSVNKVCISDQKSSIDLV